MRITLIVNPRASSMTPRRRDLALGHLAAGNDVVVAETRGRGHATDLAAVAATGGSDVVVVAAGDGTLNEAAQALVDTDVALATLPGGSTNVFARTLGFGNRFPAAVERLAAAIAAGSTHRIGVGSGNGRRFLFHLGAGFDAAVIERIEQIPRIKRYAAHPAFAIAAVDTFARGFDRRRPAMRVEVSGVDGSPASQAFFTIVSNTVPYTFVGPRPMVVTTATDLDRPLAITAFTDFGVGRLLGATGSAVVRARRVQRTPEIVQAAEVTDASLVGIDGPFPWQVDGDYLGLVEHLTLRYEPTSLSVVVPTPA